MNRTKTQALRLMELDRLIREGHFPNALTFSEEYEVSQKTVQRDFDFLRNCGAPLEYDREKRGYRYTDHNWFLPAINMSERGLTSLLLAKRAFESYRGTPIAKELEKLLNKVTETQPTPLSMPPELVFARFSFVTPPAKPVAEPIWNTLVSGVLLQRAADITYYSLNSRETTTRTIEPYHITNLQGEWYVLANCHTAKCVRQFALSQIKSVSLISARFEIPSCFDPDRLLKNTFRKQVTGTRVHQVRLRFDKSVVEVVTSREWQPRQQLNQRKDGSLEFSFPCMGLEEVASWVLSWGAKVDVLAPAELKQMVSGEIKLMAKKATGR
jgi:predicted DNA-binding transcriptional regulator YafY